MPFDPLQFSANALAGLSSCAIACWTILLVRTRRGVLAAPTVSTGLDLPPPPGGWPRLSIVVPAHNEKRVIATCAASLLAQDYENLQIIFVLDRCTDDTAALLRESVGADPRVQIIENGHCPDDWAGKCNAARLGAAAADGDWVLFTDADTQFDPKLLRAAVALALDRKLDLLSVLSTLTVRHRFELIIQPMATLMLLMLYPLEMVNRSEATRPFANGQFMLFRRQCYDGIGGHEAVKDDLLEDIAFARLVYLKDGRGGIVRAGGMLVVSMYDSFEAFARGWKRIFIEACKRKTDRLRKLAWRILAIGFVTPIVQLAAICVTIPMFLRGQMLSPLALLAVVAAGWAVQLAALGWIYAMSGAPKRGVLLYAVGCWFLARIIFQGAKDLEHRRPVRWGGRQYVLEPR